MITSEKNVLCLEFDFGQNLPLPKIPVSDQFYKRLMWLHIFNVHVLGADHKRSYMYLFMEGNLKKGSNTVCNFLFDSIQKELKLNYYNKIYLLSDGCGGQNKNYLVLSFLSLLSKKLQNEIHHVFPVRRHSYCSCDRNFGMYGQKKKRMETIETVDDYIQIIKSARDPPFTVIRESEITVNDFEMLIPKQVNIPTDFRIKEVVRISYFPNSHVSAYTNYTGKPREHIIATDLTLVDLLKTQPAYDIGVNKEKLNDVQTLMKYLSPKGKEFFDTIFEQASVKVSSKKALKEEPEKSSNVKKESKKTRSVKKRDSAR